MDNKSKLRLKLCTERIKQVMKLARAKQIVVVSHNNSNYSQKPKAKPEEKDEEQKGYELLEQIEEFTEYLQELGKKISLTFSSETAARIMEDIVKELKISMSKIERLLYCYTNTKYIEAHGTEVAKYKSGDNGAGYSNGGKAEKQE